MKEPTIIYSLTPVLIEINENVQSGNNRLFIDKFNKLIINNSFNIYDIIELQLVRQELILIKSIPCSYLTKGKWYHSILHKQIFVCENENQYFEREYEVIVRQSKIPLNYIHQFIKDYNNKDIKNVKVEMEFTEPFISLNSEGEPIKNYPIEPVLINGYINIV